MTGKRSISFRIRVEPHTTSGTLTARPSTTSSRSPRDAPAIASTLSSPISASATTMVRSAAQKPSAAATSCDASSCFSSFQAIGSSNRPPASIRPGNSSSQTTTAVSAMRTATAPKLPQNTAFFCSGGGSLRAASAITMALSPASTRSSRMMVDRPERKLAGNSMRGSDAPSTCSDDGRAQDRRHRKSLVRDIGRRGVRSEASLVMTNTARMHDRIRNYSPLGGSPAIFVAAGAGVKRAVLLPVRGRIQCAIVLAARTVMSAHDIRSAVRPDPDQPMVDIADYVADCRIESKEAYDTARYMLLDSLATAMMAMRFPECVKHLGPLVPGATLPGGARVPGTSHELDPVQAAFAIGTQIRWLDFNDTWLAAEWGHPSDNLGTILALGDYLSRKAEREGGMPLHVRDVLGYAIKAHEIQGCYALLNSFNRVGQDHVILVRLASTAVATAMLGGDREQITTAVSHSWIDNGALRTYRHAPNTGPRKSWAAGDACRRAVTHAINAVDRGAAGYPSALSAHTWGYY